jgi:hypothetical protein
MKISGIEQTTHRRKRKELPFSHSAAGLDSGGCFDPTHSDYQN